MPASHAHFPGTGGRGVEGRGILRLFPPPFPTTTFVQQIHSMDKNKQNPPVLRIRIEFSQVSRSGSGFGIRIRIRIQEGKNGPKKSSVPVVHCWTPPCMDFNFTGPKPFSRSSITEKWKMEIQYLLKYSTLAYLYKALSQIQNKVQYCTCIVQYSTVRYNIQGSAGGFKAHRSWSRFDLRGTEYIFSFYKDLQRQ